MRRIGAWRPGSASPLFALLVLGGCAGDGGGNIADLAANNISVADSTAAEPAVSNSPNGNIATPLPTRGQTGTPRCAAKHARPCRVQP